MKRTQLKRLKAQVNALVEAVFETVEEIDTRYRDLDQKVEHLIKQRDENKDDE